MGDSNRANTVENQEEANGLPKGCAKAFQEMQALEGTVPANYLYF